VSQDYSPEFPTSSIDNNNEKQCASGGGAHSVRLLATHRREITMNNNETSARRGCGHAGAFCAPRVNPSSKCSSFRWGMRREALSSLKR
jgi:hypothetical protein